MGFEWFLKIEYSFGAEDFKSSRYIIPNCFLREQNPVVAGDGKLPVRVLAWAEAAFGSTSPA